MRKCFTCGYTVSDVDWKLVDLKKPICVNCGNVLWEHVQKGREKCPNCGSKRLEVTLDILIDNALETRFEYDDKGTVNIRFECRNCLHCWSKFYVPREDQNVISEYAKFTRGDGLPLTVLTKEK